MARDALLSSGILRTAYEEKGLVRVNGHAGPILLQAVGPVLNAPRHSRVAWQRRKTRLVLITKGLEPSDRGRSFDQYVLAPA